MKENYYFGMRPPPPETRKDSPFRLFIVQCLRCHCAKLKVVGGFDEETGELQIFLVCPTCNVRERLPVC